jgi:hypothetical protein
MSALDKFEEWEKDAGMNIKLLARSGRIDEALYLAFKAGWDAQKALQENDEQK